MAERIGMPRSTYACLEGGLFRIKLDTLFRILGVLEVDITEIWPAGKPKAETLKSPGYLKRIQEMRLAEVVSLSRAEGGALFSGSGGDYKVLLWHDLTESFLERLRLYLEGGRKYENGLWLERREADTSLYLFLKVQRCPDYVKRLAEHYMAAWCRPFDPARTPL